MHAMSRTPAILALAGALLAPAPDAAARIPSSAQPVEIVSTAAEPISEGPFKPTWESLAAYEVPEWFRDAKFGIWAHWGPQCQPEANDWYARGMYLEGHWQSKHHRERYGHPSEFGFKDVIHTWKADKWEPGKLVAFYKKVGARYFFAMANHHDNLDLWDSKHQAWNSVRVGPKKDLIAGWAAAARAQGLPFGVSVHSAHAWSWYEPAQGADKNGPKAGVPYDGKLTKADGKGKWWEGLDPQELYAQNHKPSPGFEDEKSLWGRWDWGNGVSQPDLAYSQNFYDRTADLINRTLPDLLYFDDTVLPLWPVSDAGLKAVAHYYNSRVSRGFDPGVVFGKVLDESQRDALVWDIERGVPSDIVSTPWQTCTCLGGWHYDRGVYDRSEYKSARTVVHMLADIVSKNGNLLLNVPVRGDGSIDDKEVAILEQIRAWLDVNQESVFATRPWKTFGEGPASDGAKLEGAGFNEGKAKPFTPADVRYTTSKDGRALYVISLGAPTEPLRLAALGRAAAGRDIADVRLVGGDEKIEWSQSAETLTLGAPRSAPNDIATVFKLTLRD